MTDEALRARVEDVLRESVRDYRIDGQPIAMVDEADAASALVALFAAIVRAAAAAEEHLAPDWESNIDGESFMRCGGCGSTGWGQADIDHDDDCLYLMLGSALNPPLTPPADT